MSTHDTQTYDRQWHLDKKVPLALIVTIILQTLLFVWGASNLWTRQGESERRIEKLESKVDSIYDKVTEIRAAVVAPARGQGGR